MVLGKQHIYAYLNWLKSTDHLDKNTVQNIVTFIIGPTVLHFTLINLGIQSKDTN